MLPSCSIAARRLHSACGRSLAPRACVPLQQPRRTVRLSAHRAKLDDDDKKYHDDEWHFLPMGESDMQHQCTVNFLSRDMKKEELVNIQTISQMGFRLADGGYMLGPIACFPKTVLSWRVLSPSDITPESLELFFLLQPKLDVLIIGVGDRKDIDSVRARVAPAISKNRIGYEILTSEDAVSTFNFLNGIDNRYVAAALFPPKEIKISTDQWEHFLQQHVPESFKLSEPEAYGYTMAGLGHQAQTCVEKIWGYGEKSEKVFEHLTKVRDEKQRHRMDRITKKIEREKAEHHAKVMAEDRRKRLAEEKEQQQALEEHRKGADQKHLQQKKDDDLDRKADDEGK